MAPAVPSREREAGAGRLTARQAALRAPYHLYGLCLYSEFHLPYSRTPAPALAEVDVRQGSARDFSEIFATVRGQSDQSEWNCGVLLPDGQTYLRWPARFEFLISADGRSVLARPLRQSRPEAFHTYLLGQALSFALVKQGFEPLHATVVIVDGAAVAFLGNSGYGKSSLGAAFVQEGYPLLTDDLLVLSRSHGGFVAHPGPPRIKLFPVIARRVLGSLARGTPVAKMTLKLVLPLGETQVVATPVPLRAMYVLTPPPGAARREKRSVRIKRLTKRRACVELLRNTFNTSVADPSRLERQFRLATQLATSVPVSLLVYPRLIDWFPSVRKAILADLSG